MCRLFAFRANRPTSVEGPLVSAPHSLMRQSCGDRRGECHDSGWGIGFYHVDRPQRIRSARPAADDPAYGQLAHDTLARTMIAHVRQASVGSIAERNNHPFVFGRLLFAHNGTLQGFAANPERLLNKIPAHLRDRIEGETDSEHVFFYLLGKIEHALGNLETTCKGTEVAAILREAVLEIAALYPGTAEEPSRLNFVLTDGETLAASRWGHSLHLREQRDADAHTIWIASEPATSDSWLEVPDRSLILIQPNLDLRVEPIS